MKTDRHLFIGNIVELKERLWQHHEDYGQGNPINLFEVCYDCKEAADKLEELQRFIDDMLGDHYVDYLEFYANRCRELEEELDFMMNKK